MIVFILCCLNARDMLIPLKNVPPSLSAPLAGIVRSVCGCVTVTTTVETGTMRLHLYVATAQQVCANTSFCNTLHTDNRNIITANTSTYKLF